MIIRQLCRAAFAAVAGLQLALFGPGMAEAKTIALIIGIGRFIHFNDHRLDGPTNDVATMVELARQNLHAAPDDIRVLTDQDATRAAIRRELADLVSRSAPGDTVVIYYSGHGTSPYDPLGSDLPNGTSAWIPADFEFDAPGPIASRLITGRLDLIPLALDPLDRGGRQVLVISDSCFSGRIVRGFSRGISKYLPMGGGNDLPPSISAADFKEPSYPFHHVVMLSASADTEAAADLAAEWARLTYDGKPRGALTNALTRVLRGMRPADYNHDGQVSLVELQRAVNEDLAEKGLPQSPQILPTPTQDTDGLTRAAMPGVAAIAVGGNPVALPVTLGEGTHALAELLARDSEIALVPQGGAFVVHAGAAPGRYALVTAAGDSVVEDAEPEQIMARLQGEVWVRRLIAGAQGRIALAAEAVPAALGGNFVIGRDHVRLAVKADRSAAYVVFDLDPKGALVMLWPTAEDLNRTQPADLVQTIAQSCVSEPAGIDHVVVVALPVAPDGIGSWTRLTAPFGSGPAQAFRQWLASQPRDYAAMTIDLRTTRSPDGKGTPCPQ